MNYIEIGTVSYFTNVPKDYWPSDEEAEFVAARVMAAFEAELKQSPLAGELVVIRAEYEIGCIITTLILGATGPAIFKFVKDYAAFRKGLVKLLRDLNGIRLKLKNVAESVSTWICDDDVPSEHKVAVIAKKAEDPKLVP